jgi:hypothetical protein
VTGKEHNKLVGILLLAHGCLQAVVMLFLCLIYGGIGSAIFIGSNKQEERLVGMIFIVVILFLAIFSIIFVIPQIIGGWKMITERPNARTWGIIGSIISCISFPLGTAAGVFGLVFLFGEAGKRFYFGGSAMNSYNPPPPPRPNSWQ